MIKSFDRKFLSGILVLIFLLTMALPDVTLSGESQDEKQNVLRQASKQWMEVGIQQYQKGLFTEAEQSFSRAFVFHKYLSASERRQLKEFLANTRTAISKEKQALADTQTADIAVEPNQPVKAEVKVEKVEQSRPSTEQARQQTVKEPAKITSQPARRQNQSVKPAGPEAQAEPEAPEVQPEDESLPEVIVIKDKSFRADLSRLSDWLTLNRRNILMIGLPTLAVLIIISKLKARRKWPGKRMYKNYTPTNISYIGNRLNSGNKSNKHRIKSSKKVSSASAPAAKPERKSFEQSTEHWNKLYAINTPDAGEPEKADEKQPQRKEKSKAADQPVAEAGQKRCRKCEQTKPHSDFHKNKSSKDGLASWCKECKKQYRKKRAAKKD